VDVTIPELAAWYLRQDDVRVVLCYVEAIRDPAGMSELGALARSCGKSVVVMKAGRTPEGQRAAAAHTGALATSDLVTDAALRSFGLLRANSFDSLIAAGALLARFDAPPTGRVGVYAQGGGVAVVAADLSREAGLHLPELSPSTISHLKTVMPDTSPGNPFDSGGQFLSQGVEPLVEALEQLAADPNIDCVVCCVLPVIGHRVRVYAEGIARAAKASSKPFIVFYYRAGSMTDEGVGIFRDAGVLILDPPEAAFEGVALWLASAHQPVRAPAARSSEPVAEQARALVARWRAAGTITVPEQDAYALLSLYAIPHARYRLVHSRNSAVDAVNELGGPVAVKVVSPQIAHRANIGGVLTGVAADGVAAAFDEVVGNARAAFPRAPLDGALVAEMAPEGLELIVGAHRDPTFGPAVLLGLGGIWAEALRDTAMELAPFERPIALAMSARLRGAELLRGGRGRPGVDLDALADVLVRLGELAVDLADDVVAVDLNPVIALEPGRGVVVVDALVELAGTGEADGRLAQLNAGGTLER
jgi:acyl-CoA synthetase (NDP forming)